MPVITPDDSVSTVLSSIAGKYEQLSKYDTASGEWKHYVGNAKFDQFNTIEYGEGYLIYCKESCTLTLTGNYPLSAKRYPLKTGWNLISAPTDSTISASEALAGITYDSVKLYNGSTYNDATTLENGKAYFVHVSSNQTWNIPLPTDETNYVYDGDGGRVKRIAEDKTTIYIGSSYEIEVDNATGQVVKSKRNIFMGSNRVCEVEDSPTDGIHCYFVHADHIGSSNIITDETGQRASLFEYEPFGTVTRADQTNTYDTDKRFTGKTYDSSTGLYYYGARYYDPELGRFISADPTIQHPYDPQDFNRYAYCRNNPVKYVDPTGYGFWSWLKSFFSAFVGAAITAILSPILTPPIAGMIGGAVAGAMHAALNGQGLEGALKGALWGGAFGLVAGGMYHGLGPGLGAVFLGGVAIGGAVYAGVAGGGEGLANYGAGALGAFYGASLGNALINPSQNAQTQTETQSTLNSEEQQQFVEQRNAGQLTNPTANTGGNNPSAIKSQEEANITRTLATKGEVGPGNNPQNRLDVIKQRASHILSKHQEIHNNISEAVKALAVDSPGTRHGLAIGGALALKTGLAFLKCSAQCFAYGPAGWPAGIAMGFLGIETMWVGVDIWAGLWKAQIPQPHSQ